MTDAPQGASVLQLQLGLLDFVAPFVFLVVLPTSSWLSSAGLTRRSWDKASPASAGLGRMIAAAEVGLAEDAQFGDRLRIEYTRLFEGPGQMPAVPFASFHLSRSKALMTQDTLLVRGRYLEAGLAVEALNRVPRRSHRHRTGISLVPDGRSAACVAGWRCGCRQTAPHAEVRLRRRTFSALDTAPGRCNCRSYARGILRRPGCSLGCPSRGSGRAAESNA